MKQFDFISFLLYNYHQVIFTKCRAPQLCMHMPLKMSPDHRYTIQKDCQFINTRADENRSHHQALSGSVPSFIVVLGPFRRVGAERKYTLRSVNTRFIG